MKLFVYQRIHLTGNRAFSIYIFETRREHYTLEYLTRQFPDYNFMEIKWKQLAKELMILKIIRIVQ